MIDRRCALLWTVRARLRAGRGGRWTRGRVGRAGVVLGCALAGVLALTVASASAAVIHTYACQITGKTPGSATECHSGGSATPLGALSSPDGVTISGGAVWATSPGTPAVDAFDATGAFASQISGSGSFGRFATSVTRNDSTQYVYLADSGPDNVKVFNNTGAFVTTWSGSTTPSGSFGGDYVSVAVDNSAGGSAGDVYVLDSTHRVIDKLSLGTTSGSQPAPVAFSGSASYISGSQLRGTPSGSFAFNGSDQNGLSVDASGNLYVVEGGTNVVDEFSSSGTFVRSFTGAATPAGSFASIVGVGVNDATGEVYVAEAGHQAVDEFSSAGTFIGQITGGATPAGSFIPGGVAVDPSGDVYVTDSGHNVIDKFGPGVLVPDVSTGQASNPSPTGATLNGTVNPDGVQLTDCHFDYGTTTAYGQSAPCGGTVGSGSSPVSVRADVSGLAPLTVYHFRLVASNANGTSDGADQSFRTPGPPIIDGQSATNLDDSHAQLQAQVNPNSADTSCQFQYGTDTGYGHSAPCVPADLGSGLGDQAAHAWVTGLQGGITYHYRVVATNTVATVQGPDQTFTTATAPVPAPGYTLQSLANPTNFTSGDTTTHSAAGVTAGPQYEITASNAGAMPTDGSPVTITDTLPAGVTPAAGVPAAQSIELYWFHSNGAVSRDLNQAGGVCTTVPLQCTLTSALQSSIGGGAMRPGDRLLMVVFLDVGPSASGSVTNQASVSGGGAPDGDTTSQNTIAPTTAPFGIQALESGVTGVDGTPDTQAGGHPYGFTTTIDFPTDRGVQGGGGAPFGDVVPLQDAKDVTVDLPSGLIGDPQATPQCSLSHFQGGQGCPADSQVGEIFLSGGEAVGSQMVPLYNIAAPPGTAGEFGFTPIGVPQVTFTAGVRAGDYGLRTTSAGITQIGLKELSVTLWGVPADPSHDSQRGVVCDPEHNCTSGVPSGAPARPFLTNPTDCSAGGSSVNASTDSWQNQGAFQTASAQLPAVTGCDALSFSPTLSVAPDTTQAGAPAGLSVELGVPQNDAPLPFICGGTGCGGVDPNTGLPNPPIGLNYSALATPELRDTTVTLPAGMAINPSSGDGLQGCSDQQIDLGSNAPATCPDASKIGSVQLHTPLLDHTLPGDVFLGTPLCNPCSPSDAASGRMVRLFIQIDDPQSGIVVKLPGTVAIDQSTGQLTASFKQNPQLPFDDLKLQFKTGPRAPLVNPSTCGTFTTTGDLAPWSAPFSGADATLNSSFQITGCGNPNTFAPTFTAGVQNPQAGTNSPFVLSFSRTDADQQLSGLSVTLPPGLSAKLADVPLCSDSDAAAGTCPASSQVGTVQTGAGAGSEPLFLPGKAFLTGPYKGGPYGIAVAVPAIAGPFNLGMVVVRQALYVDPTDAHVTVVSDPFPQQLDGIPLRLRRVDVSVNRPDFMLNPTSCDPMQVTGKLTSTGGMTAPVSSRFQVGGCQELGFSPKLAFKLTGKGQTHSGQHPTLTATLTQGTGQANMQSAKVALPLALALDPNNSQHVCNYDVAQAVHGGAVGCPASTIVGTATAVTPLLSQPLTGPVYLVQGIRFGAQGQRIRTLPTLLIPLSGQIALDLRAQSSVNGAQQLVTTFSTIPDAPVTSFKLQINGGPKGLLVITGRGKTICGKAQIANGQFGAQSGKTELQNPKFSTPACKGVSHHKRHNHK